MKASIVIPIYKANLSSIEKLAFKRCLNVLNEYDINIITFRELNITEHKCIASEYNIDIKSVYFDKKYFNSIYMYNKLLMSIEFYRKFIVYEYILIYQLDAYVFNNELKYWCSLNYDYVGAPWFENFLSRQENKKLWKVGNGGFSLRKVSKFIEITNTNEVNYNFKFYYNYFSSYNISFINKVLLTVLCIFKYRYKVNEDYFLVYVGGLLNDKIKLPNIYKAISFSFEKSPDYLFKLNNNKLPFGCHAFEKNEYECFWKKYINN
ncbi:MAG: DUF5672 family protein [Bacteroidales bacterium]|jgi:hypothetical protein